MQLPRAVVTGEGLEPSAAPRRRRWWLVGVVVLLAGAIPVVVELVARNNPRVQCEARGGTVVNDECPPKTCTVTKTGYLCWTAPCAWHCVERGP